MNYHMSIADTVDRLRRPEYTGANRCTPCTVVNVLIAAVVSGAVALLVPAVGVVAFFAAVGIIYLRGYLVPGTPALTKRYLPARVLRLFGKEPIERSFDGRTTNATSESVEHGPSESAADESDDEPGGPLAAAGVVNRTEGDIDLTSGFREEWRERIHTVRERSPGTEDVRATFDAESVSRHGDQSFVLDGNTSIRWGSNAALVADIAAAELLREHIEGWSDFDRDRQRPILLGLRLCLDRCPSCDGALDVTEGRVDPCCQKPHLVADSVCRDCGAALADAAVVDHGKEETVRMRLLQS